MVKIPKRLRWWFHPKDGSNPTIIKTSVNGKPYVARGIERREFLSKGAKMAAVGGLGVALGSMGLPVEASPPTNWNLGPGTMAIGDEYVIFQSSNNSWYRKRGDTAAVDDNSEADSTPSDPVPLINRTVTAIATASNNSTFPQNPTRQVLTVKGNFTSSTTITLTTPLRYCHYGYFFYTGTGVAIDVTMQIYLGTQGTAFYNFGQGSQAVIVEGLIGPNTTSPYTTNPNCYGIRINAFCQGTLWVGQTTGFAEALRFEYNNANASHFNATSSGYYSQAGNVISLLTCQGCNIGIHFAWDNIATQLQGGGNLFTVWIFGCIKGIVIDNAGAGFENNTWLGESNCVTNDYVNNSNQTGNQGNEQLILFNDFLTNNSTFGPYDTIFVNARSPRSTNPLSGTNSPMRIYNAYIVNLLTWALFSTGAGSAALGSNCPAVTPGAPYKWIQMLLSDGSTVYVPCWK